MVFFLFKDSKSHQITNLVIISCDGWIWNSMVIRLHICVYLVYEKGPFFVQVCIKLGVETP